MKNKGILLLIMLLFIGLILSSCGNTGEGNGSTGVGNTDATQGNGIFQTDLKNIIEQIYAGTTGAELPETEYKDIKADNVEFYLGSKDFSNITQAVASDPKLSTVPYSVCILRVSNANQTENMKNNIKSNINLSKWICDRADCVYINNCDNVIIVIMGKESTVKAIYASFQKLAGTAAGKLLQKNIDE